MSPRPRPRGIYFDEEDPADFDDATPNSPVLERVGAFGEVVFRAKPDDTLTFQKFTETHPANYAQHDVLDSKARLQFMGVGLADRGLSIDLIRGLCDPEKERARLISMRDSGKAYALVIGSYPHGEFVLEKLVVTRKITGPSGILVSATVELTLLEYN